MTTFTATPTPFPLGFATRTPTRGSVAGQRTTVDLVARAMEVTQGVQDFQNRIPLVTKRWTAVRLYTRVDDGPEQIGNVRGVLGGWRGNQFLGVIFPENGPISARADGGDRTKLDDSLYFYLPTSWREGTVRLRGIVYQTNVDTLEFEPDADNNQIDVTVTFHEVAPLVVRLVPEHLHDFYDGDLPESTFYYFGNEDLVAFVMLDLFRYLPISALYWDPSMNFPITIPDVFGLGGGQELVLNGPVFPELHNAQGNEWNFVPTDERKFGDWPDANAAMSIIRSWSPSPQNGYYWYGMVPARMDTGGWTGLSTNGVASGKFGFDTSSSVNRNLRYGGTVAHELGHKILPGADHVNCKGSEINGGSLDDEYPYPLITDDDGNVIAVCAMAALDPEGFYGFDIYWSLWPDLLSAPDIISNDPGAPLANRGFPYMGYKGPKWVDPYDYCKALAGLGVECDKAMVAALRRQPAFVSSEPVHGPPASAVPQQTALLSGQAPGRFGLISLLVTGGGGRASIEHFTASEAAPAGAVDVSRRRLAQMRSQASFTELVVRDGRGAVLSRQPIVSLDPAPHDDAAGSADAELRLTEWIPLPQGAASIEVQFGGATLARIGASAQPPTVRLLSPNEGKLATPLTIQWRGDDADGDPLLYTVLYSPDDGANWEAILANVRETKVVLGELGPIGGSSRGRFKVIASDGFLSAEDISDGLLFVADRAPFANVLSPGNGGRFPETATVTFRGTAYDVEEHTLTGAAYRWRSDRDGDLGAGEEVQTRRLRPGLHRVTLTVRDLAGNEATDTVELVIEATGRSLPDEAEERALAKLFTGQGRSGDGGGAGALLWAGGAIAGGIAGLGATLLWRRRKVSSG